MAMAVHTKPNHMQCLALAGRARYCTVLTSESDHLAMHALVVVVQTLNYGSAVFMKRIFAD